MDRYLAQLLEDIAAAAAGAPAALRLPDEFDDPFDALEENEYTQRVILGELLGLPQIVFPPADRLSETQLVQLLNALEPCLERYGYRTELPGYLHPRNYYLLLRERLGQEVPYLPHVIYPLDLCDQPSQRCILGDECQCREVDNWAADQLSRLPTEDEWEEEDDELSTDWLEDDEAPEGTEGNRNHPFLSDLDAEEDEEERDENIPF